jgi:putative transposase
MPDPQSTIITALLEQLITTGPESLGQVFTALFDLAMRLERERHLGAERYERSPERRGYANGYKPKTLDTPASTLTVQVPKPGMPTSRSTRNPWSAGGAPAAP